MKIKCYLTPKFVNIYFFNSQNLGRVKWDRNKEQTDSCRSGGAGGDRLKEGERIGQRTYMTHGHGQWCGDCQRGWAGWRGAKGENWDNCNNIDNKIKNKIK